jgi:site-specific recombinase XerD
VVGKGRSEEEPDFVPMSEEYKKRFLEFKRMVEASGILTDWVFFKEGASDFHYHKWNIWNWHKTIGKRCGIALHTHRGRHSLCTRLNESEIALFTKQKISRHKSPEMLLRYTKIDNKDVIDAVHKAIP